MQVTAAETAAQTKPVEHSNRAAIVIAIVISFCEADFMEFEIYAPVIANFWRTSTPQIRENYLCVSCYFATGNELTFEQEATEEGKVFCLSPFPPVKLLAENTRRKTAFSGIVSGETRMASASSVAFVTWCISELSAAFGPTNLAGLVVGGALRPDWLAHDICRGVKPLPQ